MEILVIVVLISLMIYQQYHYLYIYKYRITDKFIKDKNYYYIQIGDTLFGKINRSNSKISFISKEEYLKQKNSSNL